MSPIPTKINSPKVKLDPVPGTIYIHLKLSSYIARSSYTLPDFVAAFARAFQNSFRQIPADAYGSWYELQLAASLLKY